MRTAFDMAQAAGKSDSTGGSGPAGRPDVYGLRRGEPLKVRGQALIVLALTSILLTAVVGLAIDGGSMYNQRRLAQNGTDGAAMAGTRQMLTYFDDMARAISALDDNWPSADQATVREDTIRQDIERYVAANGLRVDTLQAYFVDDQKNIVTVNMGEEHGGGHCGIGNGLSPCQVGSNGVIPWQEGAKGIWIKNGESETDSFFVRIIGWSKISASATATAFMGVAADSGYDVNLLPVGFFTTTDQLNALVPEQNYTLIAGDVVTDIIGTGNWGWVNYTPNPSGAVLKAWIDCGFNPAITVDTWPTWCPQDSSAHGEGPAHYWMGWPDGGIPITGEYLGVSLRFGNENNGWWVQGSTGTKESACHTLGSIPTGKEYIVPVFDASVGGGSGTLFHLGRLARFKISLAEVRCNGQGSHWNVQGIFKTGYSPGSSGWHGDLLRGNSLLTIFLAP